MYTFFNSHLPNKTYLVNVNKTKQHQFATYLANFIRVAFLKGKLV